jgi:ATP-dependent Lon protease
LSATFDLNDHFVFFLSRDANMPENVVKVAGKELRRLKKMSPQLPEYPMLRHYLELVADLPWDKSSTEHIDIRKAKQVFMLYTLVLTWQK